MRELDPASKVARFQGGGEMAFDLFLGVPQGVATVDVTFVAGQAPFGFIAGPSVELTAEKARLGTTGSPAGSGRDW